MALDLNDESAIDYSSDIPYFPFNTYGDFDLLVLDYQESGEVGSEKNKGDKEYDTVTMEVLKSSIEEIRAGQRYVFWFQTGGDGINKKNRAYKGAELRQCVAAIEGVDPTSAAYKSYDGNLGRKNLLAKDFSPGETGVCLKASKGNERATEKGTYYTDKAWRPLKA